MLTRLRRGAPYLALSPVFGLVVLQLFRIRSSIMPAADWAVLELNTRSAVHFQQFVGPYSRFGFFHPGPAMFYLLAPFYLIGGERFAAMTFGMSLFSAALLCLLLHVAGRLWGRSALWGAAIVVALYIQRFSVSGFRDPWNPFFGVLPLTVAIILVPLIASTRLRWPLVVQVTLASLALQSHLGSAAVVAVLAAATAAALARTIHLDGQWTLLGRAWPSLVAIGVLWALPIAQQLFGRIGNLTTLWEVLVKEPAIPQLLTTVVKPIILLLAMSPGALWYHFGPTSPFLPPLDLALVPLLLASAIVLAAAVVIAVAWRTEDGTYVWALGTASVAMMAFGLSLTRVQGELYPFLCTPAIGLSLAIWVTTACFIAVRLKTLLAAWLSEVCESTRRQIKLLAFGAFVTLVGLSCVPLRNISSALALMPDSELEKLAPVVTQLCQDPQSDITIIVPSGGPWMDGVGFGNALARCGKSVGYSDTLGFMVGEQYEPRARGIGVQFTSLDTSPSPSLERYTETGAYRVDRVPWPPPASSAGP